MTLIHWPDDPAAGNLLGGKAMSLWHLRSTSLAIPSWFVVSPSAFEASLPPEIAHRLQSEDEDIEAQLSDLRPSTAVAEAIDAAVARLCPEPQPLAVRSSARDEDGPSASFAGQFESFLAVPRGEVAEKVAAVWRSAFTIRLRAYRARQRLSPISQAPAVLVQQLVPADVSGVAFGADPVSGRRDRRRVAAVPGLGLGLVSGESDADTWTLDAAGRVIARHPAVKQDAWRVTPTGVRRERLDASQAAAPALSDEQLAAVAAAVDVAGRHFGTPQDIEWAIHDGRLWILQSRPITALRTPVPDDLPFAIWDNSNIVESYSGVTTPLTFSFAQRAYEGVYRQFCRILAVPAARIEASDVVFRNMLGLHRGRIYYNLINWYRVLALLPGFTVNRRFMEQMMGVKEPMPDDIVASLASAGTAARLKDAARLALSLATLVAHHWRLPSTIRKFRARLDHALRPPADPLESQSAGALAASFLDLESRLLRRWDAPLINDFLTMIFFGLLRDLSDRWGGDRGELRPNDLLCDSGGMVSAEPARRIAEMARLAAPDPALCQLLAEASRDAIEHAVDQHPALRTARDAYLDSFGERCFDELKLESPTLIDDPIPLYRAIGRLASSPPAAAPPPARPVARSEAEDGMTRALAGRPVRRLVFRWILRHARAGVRERENLRLERTRLFGRVRRLFLALGHRLQEMDLLARRDDVFFLEVDDILRLVSGTATTADVRALAALRQSEFSQHRRAEPLPSRFTTRGLPARHWPDTAPAPAEPVTSNAAERQGLGCCPGRVRGRVCRVTDPSRATVPPGAVLVAERTDPGWIMLFPGAAGLLVERGSLLSHSAIVARELALPAVVSVPGLMAWLHDGDLVEFDGGTGLIRRLDPAAPEPDSASPSIPSMPPAG